LEEDFEASGYTIPKGYSVNCQFYVPHFNEKYWENPLLFNPKRFLDPKTNELEKNAYFPFGNNK
jgi:cytochrome P450